MKTTTFLRLSLLIPFLLWGLCLLLFLLDNLFTTNDLTFENSTFIADGLLLFVAFYVFGIIVWLVPYLLLASILFFWSFIGEARLMMKAFALSPIAMTVLSAATVIILDSGILFGDLSFSGARRLDTNFMGFILLAAAFALAWGYICVGIGYGIYKLLQGRGLIKDETGPVPVQIHEPA